MTEFSASAGIVCLLALGLSSPLSADELSSYTNHVRRLHSMDVLPSWTWPPNNVCAAASERCLEGDYFTECKCSEQVHLTPGSGEMFIQWVSPDDQLRSLVSYSRRSDMSNSTSVEGSSTHYSNPVGGGSWTRFWDRRRNHGPKRLGIVKMDMRQRGHDPDWWTPETFLEQFGSTKDGSSSSGYTHGRRRRGCVGCSLYDSPYIHTVKLTNLTSNTQYYYQVQGDSRTHMFVAPPAASEASQIFHEHLPAALAGVKPKLTLGLMADIGQTISSNLSVSAMIAMQPDLVLHSGDLSYADGIPSRWDSFGRMMEAVSSRFPTLHVPGNHDAWYGQLEAFNHRYRLPYPESSKDAKQFRCGDAEGGSSECYKNYWSVNVGNAHIIGVNTYDCTLADSSKMQNSRRRFGSNSKCPQYAWLEKDLAEASKRRAEIPWILVMMHTPFYNSNLRYAMTEQYTADDSWIAMKRRLEPLFYKYGVDLVINGHVHTYERMHQVYKWDLDSCGPAYLTLGDAGNYESVASTWKDPQPAWSAYRENSFGVAGLYIVNATHAYYEWNRHSCDNLTNQDQQTFPDPDYGLSVTVNTAVCKVRPFGSWSGHGNEHRNDAGISDTGHDQLWMVRVRDAKCKTQREEAQVMQAMSGDYAAAFTGSFPSFLIFSFGAFVALLLVLATFVPRSCSRQATSTAREYSRQVNNHEIAVEMNLQTSPSTTSSSSGYNTTCT